MAEYVVEEPSGRSASWRVHERIVRCRDCYYLTDSPAWPDAHECGYINRAVEPDGYCAWAERRNA